MKVSKKTATIAGSTAVVGAAIALTAGTFSYFSDTKDSNPQTVRAGTLTLAVGGGAETADVTVDNVQPGWTGSKTFQVKNTGSLPGRLYVTLVKLSGTGANMAHALKISWNNGLGDVNDTANLLDNTDRGTLQPNDSQTYTFNMSIPTDIGNEIQGESAKYKLRFDLKQIN